MEEADIVDAFHRLFPEMEADVPNWRDLLIEYLCANRNMRRQFLSR